jgi:uncharacterized cysteine cluster protein YcgN (CxxCxxCC family)
MTIKKEFWKNKTLSELSPEEWEALCDGCGICCLYKIEDQDSGEIHLTNVACRFLDEVSCVCKLYEDRKSAMPTCVKLTPANVAGLDWLPDTCAYRLVLKGKPLPNWHYLISGDPTSIHRAGVSVLGKVVDESFIDMNKLEDHVVEDLNEGE